MPARSYGKFKFHQPDTGRPIWAIQAQPHVMAVLKRHFPRYQQVVTHYLTITATREVSRDLDWFMIRYPLEPVDAESLAQLNKLADEQRNADEQVIRVLEGEVEYRGSREPAFTPRPYQLVIPAMLRATGRVLCGDELGLGKTFSSTLIFCDDGALPALVVAKTHLLRQWRNELALYYPWLRTHIVGKGSVYDVSKVRGRPGPDPDVLIMNYHKLPGWVDELAGKVRTVVFDEAQELRNGTPAVGGARWTESATVIAGAARYKVECTATPIHNYGFDIHNTVSVIAPDVLGTREEFAREWGGKKVHDPRALGTYLRDQGIMIRRTRKEVGRELPPVLPPIEQPVETDRAKLERLLEQGSIAMAQKVLADATSPAERFNAAGQLDMRVRHATGVAKAPFVAEFVRMLLEAGDEDRQKVLLVGHHHDVYEVWMDRLAEYNPVLYTGKQSQAQKENTKRRFITGDSRVMLLALRSGEGMNGLQTVCSTVVFGELDWSPAVHRQIVGRLDRDGQTLNVASFFMVSDEGSDPPMAEVLELKRRIANPITDPDAEIVQQSAEIALDRVKALAEGLLRRRGIDPNMPPAAPAGPALMSRADLAARIGGSRS